jgi:hypothetical protein
MYGATDDSKYLFAKKKKDSALEWFDESPCMASFRALSREQTIVMRYASATD